MKWLDEAQDWVWMDAVSIGGRAYHASCHAEAAKDDDAVYKRSTPEPTAVLGKRKAEVSFLVDVWGSSKTLAFGCSSDTWRVGGSRLARQKTRGKQGQPG